MLPPNAGSWSLGPHRQNSNSLRLSKSAGPPVPFRYGNAETLVEQSEVVEINGARLVAGVELDGPLWRDATYGLASE